MKLNEERFLQMYFEAEVACASRMTDSDRRRVFDSLAKVYGIGESRAEELFAVVDNAVLRGIDSDPRFKQQKRIQQFAKDFGYGCGDALGDLFSEYLDIKGKAIADVVEAGVLQGDKQTNSDVASRIMNAARMGFVSAMFISAVMFFEGVLVDKDIAAGKRATRKFSRWVSCDAQLLGLRYDPDNAQIYMSRLNAISRGLPEEELFEMAKEMYGFTAKADDGMAILRKAVEHGFAKAECYRSGFARIAHSEILSVLDKQRVLLCGDERMLNAVGTLPLKLPKKAVKKPICGIETCFSRKEEQLMVERVISSGKLSSGVCFVSDDALVLKEYMSAIESRFDGNAQCFDIGPASREELARDLGNIFLRSVKEHEKNLLLIYIPHACLDDNIKWMFDFTDPEKKAHFKVASLNVELDLSAVDVALFTSSSMKGFMQDRFTVIPLANISTDEKKKLIGDAAKRFADDYDIEHELSFDDSAMGLLLELDHDDLMKTLEQVAFRAVIDGTYKITEDCVAKCYEESCASARLFGFGRKN